ncbi:MAG: hypothetical protein ACE5OZ_07820 [Candidatus Heimdallarchaeota archaeon]
MLARSKQLKQRRETRTGIGNRYEEPLRFKTTEYLDPSLVPQRPDRWYNGSLMGAGGNNTILFGPHGRLRSLHTKITSQETPGSQPRSRLYRLVGDNLTQFFSCTILDPLIEELTTLKTLRLPQGEEEAICVVLAAVEMYLRKSHRMILKEKIIVDMATELGIEIDRKKLIAAKWLLAKSGFWREYLHEINTATYEILRNLALEIITNFPFPVPEDIVDFRRQLFYQCGNLIDYLAETRRRPQALEVYAHVIVSLAAENLLDAPILTSQALENPHFDARVYRAKRQLFEMLGSPQLKHRGIK